jgi:t-SNARE complex subunit (syntaxin)
MLGFFNKLPFGNYLMASLIFLFMLVSFYGGFLFGKVVGVNSERVYAQKQISECRTSLENYKSETNEVIEKLKQNSKEWQTSLENAQKRAVTSARTQETKKDEVRYLTKTLTKTQTVVKPIIRETKNGCSLSDITINTDYADRLRNCYSASNPQECSARSSGPTE